MEFEMEAEKRMLEPDRRATPDEDWKQIDTAPKDGTTIVLGWLPNWPMLEFAVRTRWKENHWDGWYTSATHWKPAIPR